MGEGKRSHTSVAYTLGGHDVHVLEFCPLGCDAPGGKLGFNLSKPNLRDGGLEWWQLEANRGDPGWCRLDPMFSCHDRLTKVALQ